MYVHTLRSALQTTMCVLMYSYKSDIVYYLFLCIPNEKSNSL